MERGCEMALQGTYSRRAINTVMSNVLLAWQMSSRLPRMTATNSIEFEFVKRSSTQSMRPCHIPSAYDSIRSSQEHFGGAQGSHDGLLILVAFEIIFNYWLVVQSQVVDFAFGIAGYCRRLTAVEAGLHSGACR